MSVDLNSKIEPIVEEKGMEEEEVKLERSKSSVVRGKGLMVPAAPKRVTRAKLPFSDIDTVFYFGFPKVVQKSPNSYAIFSVEIQYKLKSDAKGVVRRTHIKFGDWNKRNNFIDIKDEKERSKKMKRYHGEYSLLNKQMYIVEILNGESPSWEENWMTMRRKLIVSGVLHSLQELPSVSEKKDVVEEKSQ